METLANFGLKWGRTARKGVCLRCWEGRESQGHGGTFESWLEKWKLSQIWEAVGTHRPDACVSVAGKAEESDVLRWDF